MSIDQLLAVLVTVTFFNVALVIAIWRGVTHSKKAAGAAPAGSPFAFAAGTATFPDAPAPGPGVQQPPDGRVYEQAADAARPRRDSLPPDLADLLARPAPIAPDTEVAPASRPEDGTLQPFAAWMPHPSHAASSSGLMLDSATNLEGPASWSRILEIENARLLRFRRPVTIVMAELEGVRRLGERVGQEAVDRLIPVVADAFRKEARRSDWVARVGEARFAALMSETDEIQAINYVERVRLCCEPWLSSAAVPLRLAIGWASPTASGDLELAVRRAEERMHSDRRVAGKGMVPTAHPGPRVVSLPPQSAASHDEGEDAALPDREPSDDEAIRPEAADADADTYADAGRAPRARSRRREHT